MYIGRTRRGVDVRLSWHRWSRHARWLKSSNGALAEWLEENTPAAIVLDEVTRDGAEWETERAWIEKYADLGLLNKVGNPHYKPRRGGPRHPAAAA